MDKFFKKQLYVWTYEKIKSNPKRFGADDCNSLLMQTYIYENYNIYLPQSAYKAATTVSRIKSELLLNNPRFDNRVKHKPKSKKK